MKKIVIIGSGVGGATVAKELSHLNMDIKVIEKGRFVDKLGNAAIFGLYDQASKKQSKQGVLVYSTFMGGGAGVVSCANGVRVIPSELKDRGIELEAEFQEVEKELGINPVPESHIGPRTEKIMKAAKDLNCNIQPMQKFIDFDKCIKCGMCVLGCAYGAKWSPLVYIEQAQKNGVEFLYETCVEEILSIDGEVKGVRAIGPKGEITFEADLVILAAGGVGSAIILQNSGVENAGGNFFADLYVNTYGTIHDAEMKPEVPMAALIADFYETKGFLMAPFMPPLKTVLFMPPFLEKTKRLEQKNSVGIMVKIHDEASGKVERDGTIDKEVTLKDREKIDEGIRLSQEILKKIGCAEDTIFTTNVESAHPGGTAAVGQVVDQNLETKIKGLFVSDASVLPVSPGAPPIVTIIALAKRLAHYLRNN